MSDLDAPTISALDQFTGIISTIGDMTAAHYQRVAGAGLPLDTAAELASDLHGNLLALFATPATEPEDD